MLAAAAQQGFEHLANTLDQLPAGMGFHDCAAYISLQYVHLAEENSAYFEVMFSGGLAKADFPDLLRQAGQVQKRLEFALSPYRLKPDTTLRAAELWTIAHGVAILAAEGGLRHVTPTTRFDELIISATQAWATGVESPQ